MTSSLVNDASTPPAAPVLGADPEVGRRNSICGVVQSALMDVRPPRHNVERRRERRHPFPYPVHMTPVATDNRIQSDAAFYVLGKHLSHGGMDFYHGEPVPFRRVIATLAPAAENTCALLLDLTWCRFGAHRWYENGGAFVQALISPLSRPDATLISELSLPEAHGNSLH